MDFIYGGADALRLINPLNAPRPHGDGGGGTAALTNPEGGSPLPCVCLRVLGGDDGSRQTPMDVGGGAGTVLQLIVAGDPLDLTGLEVRAHGEGEAHRRGVG